MFNTAILNHYPARKDWNKNRLYWLVLLFGQMGRLRYTTAQATGNRLLLIVIMFMASHQAWKLGRLQYRTLPVTLRQPLSKSRLEKF